LTRNLFGQIPGINMVIYGFVLVFIVLFAPRGLTGLGVSVRQIFSSSQDSNQANDVEGVKAVKTIQAVSADVGMHVTHVNNGAEGTEGTNSSVGTDTPISKGVK